MNIDFELLSKQHEQLQLLLEPIFNNDEDQLEIFFGVYDGWLGWHYVSRDYPGFQIHRLDATFELSLEEAQGMRDEYDAESKEDEDV